MRLRIKFAGVFSNESAQVIRVQPWETGETECHRILSFSVTIQTVQISLIWKNGKALGVHGGSSRNRAVAWRDGRVEPRRRKAYPPRYVDRLSGEPARLRANGSARRLVAAANARLQQKRPWATRAHGSTVTSTNAGKLSAPILS